MWRALTICHQIQVSSRPEIIWQLCSLGVKTDAGARGSAGDLSSTYSIESYGRHLSLDKQPTLGSPYSKADPSCRPESQVSQISTLPDPPSDGSGDSVDYCPCLGAHVSRIRCPILTVSFDSSSFSTTDYENELDARPSVTASTHMRMPSLRCLCAAPPEVSLWESTARANPRGQVVFAAEHRCRAGVQPYTTCPYPSSSFSLAVHLPIRLFPPPSFAVFFLLHPRSRCLVRRPLRYCSNWPGLSSFRRHQAWPEPLDRNVSAPPVHDGG